MFSVRLTRQDFEDPKLHYSVTLTNEIDSS